MHHLRIYPVSFLFSISGIYGLVVYYRETANTSSIKLESPISLHFHEKRKGQRVVHKGAARPGQRYSNKNIQKMNEEDNMQEPKMTDDSDGWMTMEAG